MSKVNDGGPAFPSNRDMRYEQEFDHEGGMTLRQYAAIKLRVPNSGTDWLDEMIRTSLRDDLAAKAMQGMWASDSETWHCSGSPEGLALRAKDAYAMADATIEARGEEK